MFFVVALSDYTKAWLLYLGLFFVLMVMYAPGGIASLIVMQVPVIARHALLARSGPALRAGRRRRRCCCSARCIAGRDDLPALGRAGATARVMTLFGIEFDARGAAPWAARASACWSSGCWLFAARTRHGSVARAPAARSQAEYSRGGSA